MCLLLHVVVDIVPISSHTNTLSSTVYILTHQHIMTTPMDRSSYNSASSEDQSAETLPQRKKLQVCAVLIEKTVGVLLCFSKKDTVTRWYPLFAFLLLSIFQRAPTYSIGVCV